MMESELALEPGELALLDAHLAVVAPLARNGFDDVWMRWVNFVSEVESGFQVSIYEYDNDLENRVILEEIIVRLPPSLEERIRNALKPYDQRFFAVTEPRPRRYIVDGPEWAAEWRTRLPRLLVGDLKEAVEADNV
jgi:hypothetical protein